MRTVVGSCFAVVLLGCSPSMTDVDGGLGHDVGLGMRDGSPFEDADSAADARDGFGSVDGGCPVVPVCSGDVLSTCEGEMLHTTPCPFGCAPDGAGRCGELDASNLDDALFDLGAADLIVSASLSIDTDACSAPGAIVAMQGDGSEVCALVVGAFEIADGGFVYASGTRPLVVLASGAVQIDGILDATAMHMSAGAGGHFPGTILWPNGGGDGGGRAGPMVGPGGGAGGGGAGGGGAFGGAGGDGGGGSSSIGGAGGVAMPSAELIPLIGGSGGGIGPGNAAATAGTIGIGGAGGGAIQISSLVEIRVTGVIQAGGGGGRGGEISPGGGASAGGGGGSGGGILLEAPVLEVVGALWTSGGGGGGGASDTMRGGLGEDGRLPMFDRRATGGAAGSVARGASGGDSGALSTVDGLDGMTNTGALATGGGGGGGTGCIVLRDATGTFTPSTGARLSPSLGASGFSILAARVR